MLQDQLANALVIMKNYEKAGKNDCEVCASGLVKGVLMLMQKEGYIGKFEFVDDGKSGKFRVKLVGKINNCGVIKPRHPVKCEEMEGWEKKLLPARDFGMLLITTSKGLMAHKTAQEKNLGGSLLAYIY